MIEQKLPQPGEYWQNDSGERILIHAVTKIDAVLFEYASGYGAQVAQSQFLPWWTHLPDCTGWDWVPEVWPKWYVHRDADQQWYVRRWDANNAVMVVGVAPDWDRPWYTEWDGHAKAGHWIEVTEAEAKARVTPPVLKCPDCGEPVNDGHEDVCPMAWVEIDKSVHPNHVPRVGIDVLLGSNVANHAAKTATPVIRDVWPISDDTWSDWKFVCRRKDLPLVPVPVNPKWPKALPLRAWVLSRRTGQHDMAALWVTQGDLSAKGFTEVHGLQIYIENPPASGSVDDAKEASALV